MKEWQRMQKCRRREKGHWNTEGKKRILTLYHKEKRRSASPGRKYRKKIETTAKRNITEISKMLPKPKSKITKRQSPRNDNSAKIRRQNSVENWENDERSIWNVAGSQAKAAKRIEIEQCNNISIDGENVSAWSGVSSWNHQREARSSKKVSWSEKWQSVRRRNNQWARKKVTSAKASHQAEKLPKKKKHGGENYGESGEMAANGENRRRERIWIICWNSENENEGVTIVK